MKEAIKELKRIIHVIFVVSILLSSVLQILIIPFCDLTQECVCSHRDPFLALLALLRGSLGIRH